MKKKLIIFIIIKTVLTYISLPFSKKINSTKLSADYFIYNELLIHLNIGNPIQRIKGIIDFLYPNLYIPNIIINGSYNENESNTYIYINKSEQDFIYNGYIFISIKSKERLILNNKNNEITLNNISFNLLTSNRTDSKLENVILGFKLEEKEENFLYQLKEKYIISYKFNENNKGDIILGAFPHEINKSLDSKNIRLNKAQSLYSDWIIEFDYIKYGNKTDEENNAIFLNDIKGIISNIIYHKFVNDSFFDELFKKKKCYSEIVVNKKSLYNLLTIYYCDLDINITKFQSIEFYSKEMNYSFIFDYNDLFQVFNNKYVFLIFFNNAFSEKWKLGEVFIKKYNVFLNIDAKLFGFYILNSKKSEKNYLIFFIILLVLIIIILSILLYKSYKKYNKRKKRPNELDDDSNEYME